MNSRLTLLLLAFVLSARIAAQNDEPMLNFLRLYAFADRAHDVTSRDTSVGIAPGANLTVAIPYAEFDPATDKIRLGWLATAQIGYGKLHNMRGEGNGKWYPYIFDIGLWGSYYINRSFEAGCQYSPIGIYGYNRYACFGSNFTLKLRAWRMQAEIGREGGGMFVGCIRPKFDGPAIQHYGIYYCGKSLFFTGIRFMQANLAEKNSTYINKMSEFRFVIGVGLSNI